MKRLFAFLVSLIVIVFGLSFAVLNAQPVRLNYYFASAEAPLSLIVVLAVAAGAILGVFSSLAMVLGSRREVHRLQRKVHLTERELKNLREIPIRD